MIQPQSHTKPQPGVPEFASVYHNDPNYGDHFAMVYDWTWEIPLSSVARTIYHYLLHKCGQQKKWTLGRKELATVARVSERRLPPYIAELAENGLITVVDHYAAGLPSAYHIRTKAEVAATQSLLESVADNRGGDKTSTPGRGRQNVGGGRQNVGRGATKRPKIIAIDTDIDTKTDTKVGADKPRRAKSPPSSERIKTDIDETAPLERRLALQLARYLDWKTMRVDVAASFDAMMRVRLAEPFDLDRYADAEDRVLAFLEWFDSNKYWRGKGQRFNAAALDKEWDDWLSQDEPRSKSGYGRQKPVDVKHLAYVKANGGEL